MAEVHQFIHSYVDHDAIGTHTRHLQRVIREMGIRSEIYAGEWRGERSKATFFREYVPVGPTEETVLLYQCGTASPMAELLVNRPERMAVSYHNFSPSDLIRPWEPTIGAEIEYARRQMEELAPHAVAAFGVSHFNELELRAAGYRNTSTVPLLFDPADFEHALDHKLDAKLRAAKKNGGSDWLFVGRIMPHKCQHDVVKAFAIYKRTFDDRARLHLIGGISSHRYWTALRAYVQTLELEDSVNITLGVSDGALGAYYRNADVFVCLSEHEGFGVPLLEAMWNRVPVLAFDAAAIGETLGSGGLLLTDKSSGVVATAVSRIVNDSNVRQQMIVAGQARLADFSLPITSALWREAIEKLVAGAA